MAFTCHKKQLQMQVRINQLCMLNFKLQLNAYLYTLYEYHLTLSLFCSRTRNFGVSFYFLLSGYGEKHTCPAVNNKHELHLFKIIAFRQLKLQSFSPSIFKINSALFVNKLTTKQKTNINVRTVQRYGDNFPLGGSKTISCHATIHAVITFFHRADDQRVVRHDLESIVR